MKKLYKALFQRKPAVKPVLPDAMRIYCIGDIHGRHDLLTVLLAKMKDDYKDYSGRIVFVFLGDYIDRGLQSKEVVNLIINFDSEKQECVFLRGNHEQTLLDFIVDASVVRAWLSYGGGATLSSYGVPVTKIPTKKPDLIAIQSSLKEQLPETHLAFFYKTQFCYSMGSYFFSHAGIHPSRPLAKQTPEDMMWIRDEFVNSRKQFEKVIVHGHTVTDSAELLSNRINIDTGAYSSNVLTCLVLEGEQQRLIQTT